MCQWLITNTNEIISSVSFFSFVQQIKDELCEVVQEMESHDSENKHSSKEKQMSIGRKKFNMDPKKGNDRSLFPRRCGFNLIFMSPNDAFLCFSMNHLRRWLEIYAC